MRWRRALRAGSATALAKAHDELVFARRRVANLAPEVLCGVRVVSLAHLHPKSPFAPRKRRKRA